MTYPQTSSVQATTGGQEYWRLLTQPESNGDIWESDASGRAFAIGPDSDIARAVVSYLDAQQQDLVSSFTVGVNKPFVGRVDAQMSSAYATEPRLPGRLLVSLADYVPSTDELVALPLNGVLYATRPTVDFLQYLSDVPNYLPGRADKTTQFCFNGTIPALQTFSYGVPFYGRRLGSVVWHNLGDNSATQRLYGVTWPICGSSEGPTVGRLTLLEETAVTAANTGGRLSTKEVAFDYLVAQFTFDTNQIGQFTATFTVSDSVG